MKSRNVIFDLNVSIVRQLNNQFLFFGTHRRKHLDQYVGPPALSDAEARLLVSTLRIGVSRAQEPHPRFVSDLLGKYARRRFSANQAQLTP